MAFDGLIRLFKVSSERKGDTIQNIDSSRVETTAGEFAVGLERRTITNAKMSALVFGWQDTTKHRKNAKGVLRLTKPKMSGT